MRRSLAGLLLGLASIVGSIALSSFWLQYTAFSPGHTKSAAKAVLEDTAIKNQVAKLIADNTAAQLGQDPVAIRKLVFANLQRTQGAELLADVVAAAHAKLIGASNKPVEITPAQIVPLVGNEAAATVPTIVLPVEKVTALSVIRQILKWLVPVAGGLTLVLILLGFAAHPEKSELLRSVGFLLLGMALLLVIIGYIVPTLILPLLTKNVWVGAVPRLAADALPLMIAMTLLLAGAGFGCLVVAAASKRRDRWSQPVRRTSYRDERRWS